MKCNHIVIIGSCEVEVVGKSFKLLSLVLASEILESRPSLTSRSLVSARSAPDAGQGLLVICVE